MVTGVYWRYEPTEEQRARTMRKRKMDSCTRLSISVLEFLGMAMNALPSSGEGESVLMRGDNMSTVHTRYLGCKGGGRYEARALRVLDFYFLN